jgi:hypothetical protein
VVQASARMEIQLLCLCNAISAAEIKHLLRHRELFRVLRPGGTELDGRHDLSVRANSMLAGNKPPPTRVYMYVRCQRRPLVLPAQIISGELNGDPKAFTPTKHHTWNCSRNPMT